MIMNTNLYHIRVHMSSYADVQVVASSRDAAYEVLEEMDFKPDDYYITDVAFKSEEPISISANDHKLAKTYRVRPEFWTIWGIETDSDSYIDEAAVNRMVNMMHTTRETVNPMIESL